MVVPMPLSFTATKKAIASSPAKSTASAYATGGSPFSLPTGGTSLSGSLSISTNKGDLLGSIGLCLQPPRLSLTPTLLAHKYGKGVLPPHGQTQEIWNVDVDRLYVPVHVSGNHWIALCISFVTRSIDVLDCSGRKRYKELDAFANLVPRIVKADKKT
ncbi:hypothetical protein IGI04_019675 [Brassica rapa subsp. trilocularis]|uniref:Ubiquitin-like protease family profile domain-containing protein n=1 Tax=Brassica rapa subsp. trilocularis TaxID=1813537 RepID=A0ABQ7MGI1_BRACM|nr:hypothetical protein IGI04_019675 [Brassica rapa subsp. trilocularis]